MLRQQQKTIASMMIRSLRRDCCSYRTPMSLCDRQRTRFEPHGAPMARGIGGSKKRCTPATARIAALHYLYCQGARPTKIPNLKVLNTSHHMFRRQVMIRMYAWIGPSDWSHTVIPYVCIIAYFLLIEIHKLSFSSLNSLTPVGATAWNTAEAASASA